MKLSIHILYDRISSVNCKLITDNVVHFNLRGIRFYPGFSTELSPNILYLISAAELSSITSQIKLSFLCIGEVEDTYLRNKHWSAIVTPFDTVAIDLYNLAQDIFDEYNQWKDEVSDAIFHGKSLQSIFDISSRFLYNPIALFDNSQGLLMKSGPSLDEKTDSIWSYVLKKGYSINESESGFLRKKISDSRMPFYYRSPDDLGHIERLIAPLQTHEVPFGVLAMTDLNTPITMSEYANMVLIRDIMESTLLITDEYKTTKEIPWYLYRLLTKQHVEKSLVLHHLSLIGRKIEERYFLWCFTPAEGVH